MNTASFANLLAAIHRFNDWNHPWLFAPSITASLTDAESTLFKEIWAEATNEKHWLPTTDLSHGVNAASQSLSQRFPWLSPEARNALTNAAAYQWR